MTFHIEGYLVQAGLMLTAIVMGGIVTIVIHNSTKAKDKQSIIKNMKNAIKIELEINLEGIVKINKSGIMDKDKTRHAYVCDSFAFESSVKSGNFILLDDKLRVDLTFLYGQMDYINRKKKNIDSMDFGMGSLGQFQSSKDFHIKELEEKYTKIIPKLTCVIAEL